MPDAPEPHFPGTPDPRPIFILGILPRCGSNYLADLFRLHPDCCGWDPIPIFEDHLLHEAHHLLVYAEAVSAYWKVYGLGTAERDHLIHGLGDGLIRFLTQRCGSLRFVTKTPVVTNLPHFRKLFPEAYLIILTRDGRSVTESMVKSVEPPLDPCMQEWAKAASVDLQLDPCMQEWAKAAEEILAYQHEQQESDQRYTLVRYEDLVRDVRGQMHRLLTFTHLDVDRYDFDAASNVPVKGSSVIRDESGQLSWEPRPKPQGFDPLQRHAHWPNRRHARFNWIAGQQSERLGYPCQVPDGSPLLWWVYNMSLDVWWYIGGLWRKLRARPTRVARRRRRRAIAAGRLDFM